MRAAQPIVGHLDARSTVGVVVVEIRDVRMLVDQHPRMAVAVTVPPNAPAQMSVDTYVSQRLTMSMDAALKALAEPRRRAILKLVWSQELPATSIADRFPDVSRSAVSQHLRVLKDADLLVERRDGTRRLYLANPRTMDDLRAFLDGYWTSGLDRLRDVAEAAEAAKRPVPPNNPRGST